MKNDPLSINTNKRQFDLVRYMRQELHAADLITDDEYAWLCCESDMAHSPKGGSPSPRRLEDYDAINSRAKQMKKALINIAYGTTCDYSRREARAALQP